MNSFEPIQKKIGDLYKNTPPLSKQGRESLVKAWPWIALVFGVLEAWAAYGLWASTRIVNQINNFLSYYSVLQPISTFDKVLMYVGVVFLLVEAVILLLAFTPLKNKQRKGWDLLFLGILVNLVYGLFSIFVHGDGIMSFIFCLIGSAIGFYFLYQVQDSYKLSAITKSKKK